MLNPVDIAEIDIGVCAYRVPDRSLVPDTYGRASGVSKHTYI